MYRTFSQRQESLAIVERDDQVPIPQYGELTLTMPNNEVKYLSQIQLDDED